MTLDNALSAAPMVVALSLILFAVTFALRAVNLGESWDVYVDEVSYLHLAQNVAERMQVFLYGQPFFLHPPAFFFLEAAYLKVVQPTGNVISQIYDVRYLNAGLAAASALAVLFIGRQLGGWRVGLVSAAIFALDPFVIRLNSRNYIETSAMLWVLIGYAALLPTAHGPDWPISRGRQLVAGLAFGLALLSKEMTAFLTILPLAASFAMRWSLPRPAAVRISLIALLTYLPYPLIVAASGHGQVFVEQKFRGVLRLLGVIKETGFKRPGGPSFVDAVVSNLSQFALTYVLLLLGLVAILFLYRYRHGAYRLLLTWVASAYGLIAFALLFGTLEEQFFYFVVVPAIPAVVVAGSLALREARFPVLATAIPALTIAFVVWSAFVWVSVHFTPDNNLEQVEGYLIREVPRSQLVAVVNDGAQFALQGENRAYMTTMSQLRSRKPAYAVVNLKLARGYSDVEPEVIDFITTQGQPVYSFTGRSSGEIVVYRLTRLG